MKIDSVAAIKLLLYLNQPHGNYYSSRVSPGFGNWSLSFWVLQK
jgi:hypothetical protein